MTSRQTAPDEGRAGGGGISLLKPFRVDRNGRGSAQPKREEIGGSRLGKDALIGFIALFFLLQLVVSFRYNLNWDEYFFLSHIYSAQDGQLPEGLQLFHVNLLFWLVWLPISEPDQIIVGRLFMMACETGSLVCIYRISREFLSVENALFALAAWCASGSALIHGASFRADPLAGFLLMASLALLFCGKLHWVKSVGAGFLAALAVLITVKSALYLPAFLGALYWQANKGEATRGRLITTLRYFALSAVILAATWVLLYALHSLQTVTAKVEDAHSLAGRIDQIFEKVIASQELFPRKASIIEWLFTSILTLLLYGLALRHFATRWKGNRTLAIVALAFVLPLASLAIYRNAFPYFYPFIMLPAAAVAGFGASIVTDRQVRLLLLAGMGITVGMRFAMALTADQAAQREIAKEVHSIFPNPVPYIDRNAMIPSFPKSGFFMSTLGVERYLEGATETLAESITREQPPLLILNSPHLAAAVDPDRYPFPQPLFNGDVMALRQNYVEHWGRIWVAGKSLDGNAGSFEVLIEGAYTLQCIGARELNGEPVACGQIVQMARGWHRWSGGDAVLRWGSAAPRPAQTPTNLPIYYGL